MNTIINDEGILTGENAGAARSICVELALAGASRLTIVNIPSPAFTPFLREADRRGLRWQSGMRMLVNQPALPSASANISR